MEEIVATILFADLIDFADLTRDLTLQEYDEMLADFQNIMFEVVTHHLDFYGYEGFGIDYEWAIEGDELRIFLYSGQVHFDIRNALLMAIKIKIAWLVSAYNQRILKEGRQASRIGVGINCGEVIKDVKPWRMKIGETRPKIEGYAINRTKHIGSVSREGTVSQIMVGEGLYRRCQLNDRINISFSPPQNLFFKGLDQKMQIYEVVSFINFEILPSMPSSFKEGLLEKMEHIASDTAPEPWVLIILLRSYISMLASGEDENLVAKALNLAQQALKVLDYKVVIYNMLGWLYSNCKSAHTLEKVSR
jgi:class 3 adenylate cyclase